MDLNETDLYLIGNALEMLATSKPLHFVTDADQERSSKLSAKFLDAYLKCPKKAEFVIARQDKKLFK